MTSERTVPDQRRSDPDRSPADVPTPELLSAALDRWPSAGVAVVVHHRGQTRFHGHGVADGSTGDPVDQDTVFRAGSVTKTFTAVALMQLWEAGLVDLDAPVDEYLHAFRLVPVRSGLGPVTLRHLLTHTAGIGYWPRPRDLLRPVRGSGVHTTRPVAALADLYPDGLAVEVEPGSRWMYSNHGFAAIGQVVEDVSGVPFVTYLRERVLDPLGMQHSDLRLSARVRTRLATGYVVRRHGLRPVRHREVPAVGGGALYATAADLARFVTALLGGGSNEVGSVLRPETVDLMFAPQFQPDPRIPGMGLAFHRSREGDHRVVGHDGVVSGFLSQLTLAPDAGVGVAVLTNTGGLDGRGLAVPLGTAILRRSLGLPDSGARPGLPARADVWADLCGWYTFAPGPMTNAFPRLLLGAGAEVRVRGGHLLLQPLSPVPALRRGMRLHPDDPDDPYVFRIDLDEVGQPSRPVVFTGGPEGGRAPDLLCFGEIVLHRRTRKEPPR